MAETSVARWWHVSWKRVGVTLLIIFLTPLLLAGVSFLVQLQLAPWLLALSIAANDPGIDLTPVALPDHGMETQSGVRIEHFGFSIQLPWKEIYRDSTVGNSAMISSMNGGVVEIRNPSDSLDSVAMMRRMANTLSSLRAESSGTNYALATAVMNAKPEQVKWWSCAARMRDTLPCC